MSTLIVLGNLNHFTFVNSILAASSKSSEIFSEELTDIFVIHSSASQAKSRRIVVVTGESLPDIAATLKKEAVDPTYPRI